MSMRRMPLPNPYAESMTKASPADELDINKIVDRARRGAGLPPSTRQGAYADVSQVPDYKSALSLIRSAQAVVAAKATQTTPSSAPAAEPSGGSSPVPDAPKAPPVQSQAPAVEAPKGGTP